MTIAHYFNLLVSLLAMINPIAIAPIFLALTQGQSQKDRHLTALRGATASAVIMVVAYLLGNILLNLFGIGIPAFRVAGGLLVLSLGLSMAQGKDTKHHPAGHSDSAEDSIAVVPLALPVTTGPGVLSAIVVYAGVNNNLVDMAVAIVIILLAALVVYFTFRYAPAIAAKLGPDGMSIATRISGLILAAIGVQFIALGLAALLPGLT